MKVRATTSIRASQEGVFDRLADLSRMPELSPECKRVEWVHGDGYQVGDQFRGWNQLGVLRWWTHGWIVERDHPRRLVVETSTIYKQRDEPTNRWTYELQVDGGVTEVVERLETLRLPIHLRLLGPFLVIRWLQLKRGMVRTLRTLKRQLESGDRRSVRTDP